MAKTAAQKQAAYRKRKKGKNIMGTKIDKRTRGYKDSQEANLSAEEETVGNVETPEAIVELHQPLIDKLDEILEIVNDVFLIVRDQQNGIPVPVAPPIETPGQDVEPRHEPGKPPQVAHVPDNEPITAHADFGKCMKCGGELPPTETPRLVEELCHDCVWRNS